MSMSPEFSKIKLCIVKSKRQFETIRQINILCPMSGEDNVTTERNGLRELKQRLRRDFKPRNTFWTSAVHFDTHLPAVATVKTGENESTKEMSDLYNCIIARELPELV